MAIFRAETKSISRSKGHNLVAAISYRAAIKLTDNNKLNPLAKDYDFTKKTDVVHSEILLPRVLSDQLDAVSIDLDFQSIADLVEQGETTLRGKMKNSARLGREWLLCGVPELSRAENIELFQKFASEQGEEQGVVSMCFVHDPKAGNDLRSKKSIPNDERNIHAHIVLLTRKLELTPTNKLKLGGKSDSELSNDERTRPVVAKELVGTIDPETGEKIQQGRGLCSNSQWLKDVRESWADMLNEKLLEKNVQPVSHKSYRELGLDILPKIHHGKNELTDAKKGYNDRIDERNRNTAAIKSAADSRIAIITKSAESHDRESKRRADHSDEATRWLSRESESPYDTEQAIKRFDDQAIVFNRLAEQAVRELAKPSTALIKQAVQKYRAIDSYEPMIQLSDWASDGSKPKANPEPNPILEFNQRQRDIINNISDHLTGFSDDYVSSTNLRNSLADDKNERILILLTDPDREEVLYKQDEIERTEQSIVSSVSLDITQQPQLEAGQEERKLTPHTPSNTYTPR